MRSRLAALVAIAMIALVGAGCSDTVVDGSGSRSASGSASTPAGGSSPGAVLSEPDRAAAILRDARLGVAATNSYDYRDLPAARANGLRYTTDAYRDQYARAFDTLIARNAPAQRFVQRAVVAQAGLGPVDGDGATVLVFGRLNIANRTAGDRVDPFGLVAHLRPVGSRWLLDRITLGRSLDGTAPGSAGLTAAVAAARAGARNLVTFSRASFDADYRRVLASTTGALRADVLAQRAATVSAVTKGGFDLVGVVRGCAVVSAGGTSVVALVTVDGYQVRNGARGSATEQNLQVTVVASGGRWLLSDVTAVGVR